MSFRDDVVEHIKKLNEVLKTIEKEDAAQQERALVAFVGLAEMMFGMKLRDSLEAVKKDLESSGANK